MLPVSTAKRSSRVLVRQLTTTIGANSFRETVSMILRMVETTPVEEFREWWHRRWILSGNDKETRDAIALIDAIVQCAVNEGAQELHFEPMLLTEKEEPPEKFPPGWRYIGSLVGEVIGDAYMLLNGAPEPIVRWPPHLVEAFPKALKAMAGLCLFTTTEVQHGWIRYHLNDEATNWKCRVMPTQFGEHVVLLRDMDLTTHVAADDHGGDGSVIH